MIKSLKELWYLSSKLFTISVLLGTGCMHNTDFTENSFSIDRKSYSLDNCAFTYDSAHMPATYEIDLSCCDIGNPYRPTELIEVKNFIWFSLLSVNYENVTAGKYLCSERNQDKKSKMIFSGTVTIEDSEVRISSGKLNLEKSGNEIKLTFNLVLDDRSRVKGSYSGSFVKDHI